MMTNITYTVYNFLIKNPDITKNLQRGVINTRALAQLIIEKEKVTESSIHAIISAIRRYDVESKKVNFSEIGDKLKQSKISTKSRLDLISLSRDFAFLKKIFPLLLEKINPSAGELLRVVEGRSTFKIVIDQSKKEEILSVIKPERVLKVTENLAEINVLFNEGHDRVRGMMASILNELAIKEIRVYETISCLPEFILIVKEEDIGKAHNALLEFFYD